jgi:5'-nucleotidase
MAGEPEDTPPDKFPVDVDVDFEAVKNNYISMTPLHFDLTDFDAIRKLSRMITEFK